MDAFRNLQGQNQSDTVTLRRSHRRCPVKKGFLKIFSNFFANLTGKHLCWSLSLTKLQAFRTATLLKRESNRGIFLSNLQNVFEHLFKRTSANNCFWNKNKKSYFVITLPHWFWIRFRNKNQTLSLLKVRVFYRTSLFFVSNW